MSDRATERDGEHVTAIKSDETGRWVRIPDGVDGVRAYQLLRAASTDAPSEERDALTAAFRRRLGEAWNFMVEKCEGAGATREGLYYAEAADAIEMRLRRLDRAPTDEAPEREDEDGLTYSDWRSIADAIRYGKKLKPNMELGDLIEEIGVRRLRQPPPAPTEEGADTSTADLFRLVERGIAATQDMEDLRAMDELERRLRSEAAARHEEEGPPPPPETEVNVEHKDAGFADATAHHEGGSENG